MFKRGLLAVLTLLALLLLVLVVRALVLPAPALSSRVLPSLPEQDRDAQVERLAQAIRFPTLADRPEAFDAFHAFLAEAFPFTHETLSLRPFGHSLLYHWDSGHDCAPTLLLAHQDVVPVSAMAEWQHPPFDGVVDERFIWGRGTLDDKVSVMAILEAVEAMLAEGRQPACDVWLAFGHDEETGGAQGAARMSRPRGLASACTSAARSSTRASIASIWVCKLAHPVVNSRAITMAPALITVWIFVLIGFPQFF